MGRLQLSGLRKNANEFASCILCSICAVQELFTHAWLRCTTDTTDHAAPYDLLARFASTDCPHRIVELRDRRPRQACHASNLIPLPTPHRPFSPARVNAAQPKLAFSFEMAKSLCASIKAIPGDLSFRLPSHLPLSTVEWPSPLLARSKSISHRVSLCHTIPG